MRAEQCKLRVVIRRLARRARQLLGVRLHLILYHMEGIQELLYIILMVGCAVSPMIRLQTIFMLIIILFQEQLFIPAPKQLREFIMAQSVVTTQLGCIAGLVLALIQLARRRRLAQESV